MFLSQLDSPLYYLKESRRVAIELFHGVIRKVLGKPMHRRTWGLVAKFIGGKTKDCPRVSGVSPRTRWLGWKWPASGASGPCLSSPRAHRCRASLHLCESFSVSHFPRCTSAARVQGHPGCGWHVTAMGRERESTHMKEPPPAFDKLWLQ